MSPSAGVPVFATVAQPGLLLHERLEKLRVSGHHPVGGKREILILMAQKNLPLTRRRHLPALNGLRAFEAAGRLGGMVPAAAELGVTAAAVSHHVRQLEDWLGQALFCREPRGVRLTEAGAGLWPRLTDLLDGLDDAVAAARDHRRRETLTLVTRPSLAARWLLPRLGRMQAMMGPVELRLITSTEEVAFGAGGADLALRYYLSPPPGLACELVAIGDVFPVISPRLLAAGPRVRAARDLGRYPLIQHVPLAAGRLSEATWPEWFRRTGAGEIAFLRGPQINFTHLCLQAACDGLGIALTTMALAADLLVEGRLVRPLETVLRQPGGYYLTAPADAPDDAALAALRAWILAEMAGHLAAGEAVPAVGSESFHG